jgi:hypothetical protein
MRLFAIGVALCAIISTSTSTKDIGEVVRSFGLLGTWSSNCAVKPPAQGSSRVTFSNTLTFKRHISSSIQEGAITHADTITNEKVFVELQFKRITVIRDGKRQDVPVPPLISVHQQILMKEGDKLRILEYRAGQLILAKNGIAYHPDNSSRSEDPDTWVSTGQRTPLLEKCSG